MSHFFVTAILSDEIVVKQYEKRRKGKSSGLVRLYYLHNEDKYNILV